MDGNERAEGPTAALVVRCQLGEREAFTELVREWNGPLLRYLRGMTGSPDMADDLAQDTWLAVVRGIPRLRQPERFAPWLFTIGRRAVLNRLRQTYRAADATPLTGVVDRLELRHGLNPLPPPVREVRPLFHLVDLPLALTAAAALLFHRAHTHHHTSSASATTSSGPPPP